MLPNRTLPSQQKGMTAIGWLFVLGLIGFFVLLALRLFPIYSNNFKIKGVVESLAKERNLFSMQREEVLRLIVKRNGINMVEGFDPKHFKIIKTKSGNKEYHITYEDRRPILGHLDVVAKFDNYIVIDPNGKLRRGL